MPGQRLFLHHNEMALHGKADVNFLKSIFNKLLVNFTWWVNRKDRFGKNVFEGGFLGLDNIGIFDRSAPLPTGGNLEQADGTAWMALFSQNMLEMASELALHDPAYEDMVIKFAEHFYFIAAAMNQPGPDGMWDEEDGFYYDLLRLPDGSAKRLKVRSLVGLLPLCAVTVIEKEQREKNPVAMAQIQERERRIPELRNLSTPPGRIILVWQKGGFLPWLILSGFAGYFPGCLTRRSFSDLMASALSQNSTKKIPMCLYADGQEYRVDYLPAESNTGMFGGNSNWRGPVWMPVNIMLIRALQQYYLYYGDSFKIECPTGSGNMMNLFEVSKDLSDRLTAPIPGMKKGSARYTEVRKCSRRIPTGVTTSSFTSTTTATTVPDWGPVIRQAGAEWWPS